MGTVEPKEIESGDEGGEEGKKKPLYDPPASRWPAFEKDTMLLTLHGIDYGNHIYNQADIDNRAGQC